MQIYSRSLIQTLCQLNLPVLTALHCKLESIQVASLRHIATGTLTSCYSSCIPILQSFVSQSFSFVVLLETNRHPISPVVSIQNLGIHSRLEEIYLFSCCIFKSILVHVNHFCFPPSTAEYEAALGQAVLRPGLMTK